MKYTIELTENEKKQMDLLCELAHRYIGFNPKLEPMETTNVEDTNEYQIGYKTGYDKGFEDGKADAIYDTDLFDAAYNKGLDDACLTAWTLLTSTNTGKIFTEYGTVSDILGNVPMKEIRARTKAYEEKKKSDVEIKVGDEVCRKDRKDCKVVITVFIKEDMANAINFQGSSYIVKLTEYERTGRHFDEVEQLLNKLKGE